MVAPGRHASHLDCEPASNRDPADFDAARVVAKNLWAGYPEGAPA
jgi:hypothetical protein